MTVFAEAGIGHNNPPDDIEILKGRLGQIYADLNARRDELIDAETWLPNITDDETSGKVSDYLAQIAACESEAAKAHTSEKAPYLTGGRVVDGFFNTDIRDRLSPLRSRVGAKLKAYLDAKAAAERQRAAEEAARMAAEAVRKAEEAAALEAANRPEAAEVAMSQAVEAETAAVVAQSVVHAKPAALAVAKGAYGSRSGLRSEWAGTITDKDKLDLNKLRPYLAVDALQKALNAFVKAGGRECAGTVIKEETKLNTRRAS